MQAFKRVQHGAPAVPQEGKGSEDDSFVPEDEAHILNPARIANLS